MRGLDSDLENGGNAREGFVCGVATHMTAIVCFCRHFGGVAVEVKP